MRCEDAPCCGHTDGLGCDWTYTPEARAFDSIHAICDHEYGICEVEDIVDDLIDEVFDYSPSYSEDGWLDGSYEE